MTPMDPTLTQVPQENGTSSDAAWDAGLAAAFGPVETASHHPANDPEAGTILAGKYCLSERIGEGGMGSVWVAHQSEPVKRKVAVKLIKAGMDSKQVLARFEAERQALAVMDHPNIAKVLDGGLHEGRPFFVMELVKGVPITEYCDARKLTPRERLELFVPVCQAIQHAHQKGIIHRDIKPSNVLVALYDDKPVPKVIDFGIAKATGGALTEQTLETAFGGVVGTPQYMSPEQASLNNLDIDTRSDVYSLGVLLYELLTGSPPFAPKELEKRGLLEILRVVREEEPPRPSTRLSTADALPSLSASRGTEPKKLTGLLRNELDWIVMKALEKDRARRYETANGLAADVNRYLSGDAVQAHPPSTAYRVKKFVKRNRGQVIAASLILVVLLAGIAGTTFGLIRANRSAAAERATNDKAQARLRQLERGNAVITSIFEDLDLFKVKQSKEPLEAILAKRLLKSAEQLEGEAVGDPLVVAGMQYKLGDSLISLGYPDEAMAILHKAHATHTAALGVDDIVTLATGRKLAFAYKAAYRHHECIPLMEENLKHSKARLGDDHPDTLKSMVHLGMGYQYTGKHDLALPVLEDCYARSLVTLGRTHLDTAYVMHILGSAYQRVGKSEQALSLLEEALKIRTAQLDPEHPHVLFSLCGVGKWYVRAKRPDEGLPMIEETLKRSKSSLGHDHVETLIVADTYAWALRSAGKIDAAVAVLEETLTLKRKKRGPDHDATLETQEELGVCNELSGRVELAGRLFEDLVSKRKSKHGSDHRDVVRSQVLYARNQLLQEKWVEAETRLREALARCDRAEPELWSTFHARSLLGGALLGQKKYADAEPLLLKGYEGMKAREKAIPSQGANRLPESLDRLIELYTATNKPDELKKWRAERAKYPLEQAPPLRVKK